MSLTLDHLTGKVAVVAGASSGIGEAISIALVSKGLQVVGLARRKERLEKLANSLKNEKGVFVPLQADVTREDDIINAFRWIEVNMEPIHVLINSAGIMHPKGLIDGDAQWWRETIDTNVLGLCTVTREAVKNMRANNVDGCIIHINSVCGRTVPTIVPNVYTACKWAVTALVETLRQELNSIGSKIKITSISPGLTRTDLYSTLVVSLSDQEKTTVQSAPYLEPKDIADSAIYILSTPPHVQVQEIFMRPVGELWS